MNRNGLLFGVITVVILALALGLFLLMSDQGGGLLAQPDQDSSDDTSRASLADANIKTGSRSKRDKDGSSNPSSRQQDPDVSSSHSTETDTSSDRVIIEATSILPDGMTVQPDGLAELGSGSVTLWGKVLNEEKEGIPGALLSVQSFDGGDVEGAGTAGSGGEFKFDISANERYLLRVSASGYGEMELFPLALSGEELIIVMQPGYTVSGFVQDADKRGPVTEFKILVASKEAQEYAKDEYDLVKAQLEGDYDSSTFEEYSFFSANGAFELKDLPPDASRLILIVMADGYLTGLLQVPGGRDVKNKVIRLTAGKEVRGTVKEAKTKTPVAGVKVTVMEFTGETYKPMGESFTDASGMYLVIVPGKKSNGVMQRIRFEKNPYGLLYRNVKDLAGKRNSVTYLKPGGTIEISAKTPDGDPVVGAIIQVSDSRKSLNYALGLTDGSGRFITESLNPDSYTVFFKFEENVNSSYTFGAAHVINLQEKVSLKQDATEYVEFLLAKGSTVSGRYTVDGEPQVKASLLLQNQGSWADKKHYTTLTNTKGDFSVKDVVAGDYNLKLTSDAGTIRAPITLGDNESVQRLFSIKRIPVEGDLIPASDTPATVLHSLWKTKFSSGDFTFETHVVIQADRTFVADLPAGKYTVTVKVKTKEYVIKNVVVQVGQPVPLILDDTWMGRYLVTNSLNGAQIKNGFMVNIQGYKNGVLLTNKKEQGKRSALFFYQFDFNKHNEYVLYFKAAGFSYYGPIEVAANTLTTQEVIIPLIKGKSKLTVKVENQNGDPVNTVEVQLARVGEYGAFDWKFVNGQGTAQFFNLDPGQYQVTAKLNGSQVTQADIGISPGQPNAQVTLVVESP